jgi:hypothetical protein
MGFGGTPNIGHWHVEPIRQPGSMRDTCRGRTDHHITGNILLMKDGFEPSSNI